MPQISTTHPPASQGQQIRGALPCGRCGSSEYTIEKRPPHVALLCARCGQWLRWIRRRVADNFSAEPAQTRQQGKKLIGHDREVETGEDSNCNHREQLDQLIKHLSSIDRALSIVTRALCNGVRNEQGN